VLFGGWNFEFAFNDLWMFEIKTSTWKICSSRIPERIWASCCWTSQGLFIFAGEDKDLYLRNELFLLKRENLVNGIYEFDQIHASGKIPSVRYGSAMAFIESMESLVLFGGYGGDSMMYNDLYRFSICKSNQLFSNNDNLLFLQKRISHGKEFCN
jgi:hypothetical protein